jgi:N-carbamoylputrescine amidase
VFILTPNACGLESNRIGQFRARAYENMLGLAMTNYPAPQENGHSVAFDAACFKEGEGEDTTQEPLIIEAGESEGIYLASFDIERMRRWRQREIWGNAYRKPRCYQLLTSLEVAEPFKREADKKRAVSG